MLDDENAAAPVAVVVPEYPYEVIPGNFNTFLLMEQIAKSDLTEIIRVYGEDRVEVERGIDPDDLARVLTLVADHNPEAPLDVSSVSAAQAKTALFNATLLDRVEAIVDAHPYRPVKIFYSSANTWEKKNPYVRAIAVELDLLGYDADGNEVDAGLDGLFVAANKL